MATEAETALEEAALEFARAKLNGAKGTKMLYAQIKLYAEARNFADARDEERDE